MLENQIEIYIDGSAITNPGSLVGCAGIVYYPESLNLPSKELRWSYSSGGIGAMETLALVNALKWINKNEQHLHDHEIGSVSIFSDSQYVVSAATSWIYKWSDPWNKNKWKKSDGGTVRNQGLWKEYLRVIKKIRFNINIEKIEGKSSEETKAVDKAAKKAAKSLVKKPNFEQMPYKQGRSLLGKKSRLIPFNEIGETHLIRIYSHSLVSRKRDSEYEVRFEVIKDDHIGGRFKAFTSQEIGFRNIDRGHYYYATFSDNEAMPVITEIKEVGEKELESLKEKVKYILQKQGT